MNFIKVAVIYASGIISVSIVFLFFHKTLGYKPKLSMIHRILAVLTVTAFLGIAAILQVDSAWRPAYSIFITTLSVFIFFCGKARDKLFYLTISISAISLANMFSLNILAIFFRDIYESDSIPFLLCTGPIESVLMFLTLSIITHVNKKGKLYLPGKYWLAAVISFLLIIIVNFALTNSEIGTQYGIMFAVSSGLLLVWAVLYFAFFFVCRYFAKLNEISLMAMQNEMTEKYMLQKHESDQMIRILSHDLKHNLGRLKMLAEQNSDKQAAQSITEYEQHLARYRMPDVGNDIANAVINEKRMIALRDNIRFTVKGGFSEGLTLERIDICSLLGNLLDNALEAAVQTDDESLRCIDLQISRQGHQLLLLVINGYAVEPRLLDNAFITQKKNRGMHGIGTVSINNIVEKYNGVIQNSYKDNIFKSSLMLRGYE